MASLISQRSRRRTQHDQTVVLPVELFFLIIDEAAYDDLIPRYKWLKSYCLVCRAWRSHAQRLLFSHVALLRGADQCKAFKTAMASAQTRDSEHGALLAASVRTLGMVMDHQEIYTAVLNLCTNLREVHLVLYHACFRAEVLKGFGSVPRVQALRIRSYHTLPLIQLLGHFPSVEYLEVDCRNLRDHPEFPGSPFSWRLREFRFRYYGRMADAFIERALSGPTRETLEIIHIDCPGFDLSLLERLGIAPKLRSLSVPRVGDLSIFRKLQELALGHPKSSLFAFDHLPLGVMHISLETMDRETCASVVAGLVAYQGRSNNALRVLTYNRRSSGNVDPLLDAKMLYDFCAEHYVEFHFMDPPYGHYAGERAPLGESRHFPRHLPLSSRRSTLSETTLPWNAGRTPPATLARRIVHVAGQVGRAFGNTGIPAVALARP
ncbi:hypothetical protein C8Q80DRAFT_1108927 [Daedaleopsis nitida]|nr:hypothetical protein C8Q80DRAFT_1108927 [Daedaleopsis nitida]